MEQDNFYKPIFITGIQRSGSTVIAKTLDACGVFKGNISKMYENKLIESLMREYYEGLEVDQTGQYPLPIVEKLSIPVGWRGEVRRLLKADGYDGSKVWVLKNFRLLQIWPIWHHAFPDARWLVVRRKPLGIIQSCAHTGYMTAFKRTIRGKRVDEELELFAWKWWIHEQERRMVEMVKEGLNIKEVWPSRVAKGDYQQMSEILEWLGLNWNSNIVGRVEHFLKTEKYGF